MQWLVSAPAAPHFVERVAAVGHGNETGLFEPQTRHVQRCGPLTPSVVRLGPCKRNQRGPRHRVREKSCGKSPAPLALAATPLQGEYVSGGIVLGEFSARAHHGRTLHMLVAWVRLSSGSLQNPIGSPMSETIYDALRESHEIQRSLLRKMLRSKPGTQDRISLFKQVRIELEAHEAAEERFLYAPMLMDDMGLISTRMHCTSTTKSTNWSKTCRSWMRPAMPGSKKPRSCRTRCTTTCARRRRSSSRCREDPQRNVEGAAGQALPQGLPAHAQEARGGVTRVRSATELRPKIHTGGRAGFNPPSIMCEWAWRRP